jgi:chemotaxis protein methyltransferase WspC
VNGAIFETRLKQAIGLDPASIGSSAISRAVRSRMAALHCRDTNAYAARLETDPAELKALVDAVVVPETWFFRDPAAFAVLVERFTAIRRGSDLSRRILSVPCASGEEPLSIVMSLLDAGVSPAHFQVDAVDVSEQVLARARQGSYGRNSFRSGDLGYRHRHFRRDGEQWLVSPDLQRQLTWQCGNLLDALFTQNRERYDAIFCRNLLIYFDRPTQERAVAALSQLLQPDGVLFVGPSETSLLLNHGFEPVRAPLAFGFVRRSVRAREPRPPVRRPAIRTELVARPRPPVARPAATAVLPAPVTRPPAVDPLDEISHLADTGRFNEAVRQCDAFLRRHGQSARAFYLFGLVQDAVGNRREAAALFRKAVYLDPKHHDALMQLVYLAEATGDAAGADALRARARRVTQQEAK